MKKRISEKCPASAPSLRSPLPLCRCSLRFIGVLQWDLSGGITVKTLVDIVLQVISHVNASYAPTSGSTSKKTGQAGSKVCVTVVGRKSVECTSQSAENGTYTPASIEISEKKCNVKV